MSVTILYGRGNATGRMLFARITAALLLAVMVSSCANDTADQAVADSSLAAPASPMDSAAAGANASGHGVSDTNAAAGAPNDATAYKTVPAEIVAEMSERFAKMGGMQDVRISITDAGGVVLEGFVPTPDRKQTAEDAARVIAGNVPVDNRIVVRP
ncbi:MAG: BON domain-containing protein [bacterium]|nr:BON domain-containing protein [Candidatus Kapabacteria bacterium]